MMKFTPILLVAASASVQGAVITGVGATATTYYAAAQTPTNLVNDSGLVGTGFSALHDSDGSANRQWHAGVGQGTGGAAPVVNDQAITFNLGGTYNLTSIYIWQANQTGLFGRGVNQFDLMYSIDGGGNWLTAASNLNLAISTGGNIAAQQFSLAQSGVTHVRIEIDSAHSGLTNDYVGLSEVKFDGVAAVPEPSVVLLGGLGVLGLLRRRK